VVALHIGLDAFGKKPGLGVIGTIFGWPYLWTRMAPCFLIGMAAYTFRDELPRTRVILVSLLVAGVAGCAIGDDTGFVFVLPALAYAIFYLAYADVRVPDAARYGDFSYGTYLYGYLVQKVLQATVAQHWNVFEFFVVSAILAVFAGALSWYLIEKRFTAKEVFKRSKEDLGVRLADAW
jgi:peptidoglycan/LPS O-acetylase OafA/YrhL